MNTPSQMKAVVVSRPGGPEVLELRTIPVPPPTPGRVLIKVRAFGINRSEWHTRCGMSPSVSFPRVLGIECVGEVVSAPDTTLAPGQTVAAMMGEMGRAYDGSYAEYTSVPAAHVFPLSTGLDWATLGALPEMLQTTYGSLTTGLEVAAGERLLIRGGTSSIGLAAAALARDFSLYVIATTRSQRRAELLTRAGVDEVVIDDGHIADEIRARYPAGVDRVLELIGTTTLRDSLMCARAGGVVCMTGVLGGEWVMSSFEPMVEIPTGVKLTAYSGGSSDISPEKLQAFITRVERGELSLVRGRIYHIDDIQRAHRALDDNTVSGKQVVVTDRADLPAP